MNLWFYGKSVTGRDTELAQQHRLAYEKSLEVDSPIKVCKGMYYYKGCEIRQTGGRQYPWNWVAFTSSKIADKMGFPPDEEVTAAKTMSECIVGIDCWVEENK